MQKGMVPAQTGRAELGTHHWSNAVFLFPLAIQLKHKDTHLLHRAIHQTSVLGEIKDGNSKMTTSFHGMEMTFGWSTFW